MWVSERQKEWEEEQEMEATRMLWNEEAIKEEQEEEYEAIFIKIHQNGWKSGVCFH